MLLTVGRHRPPQRRPAPCSAVHPPSCWQTPAPFRQAATTGNHLQPGLGIPHQHPYVICLTDEQLRIFYLEVRINEYSYNFSCVLLLSETDRFLLFGFLTLPEIQPLGLS